MFKGAAAGKTTKAIGDEAETRALAWLLAQGLVLVQRNYRVARGPRARGGEIDLIMREKSGELVFVEVRARRDGRFGGAAASISASKQQRIIFAARCYLAGLAVLPPCRFDVLALDGEQVQWLKAAFESS